MSNNWWEDALDISESEITLIIQLYNDTRSLYVKDFRGYIRKSEKRDAKIYGDCANLIRVLRKWNFSARDYINFQFKHYAEKKKHKYARQFPTIISMCSPASVTNFTEYLQLTGKRKVDAKESSSEDVVKYNINTLNELMKSYCIKEEIDFYKDVVLANQFPLSFLTTREPFNKLANSHFYENTFHVKNYQELFV